MQSQGKAKAQQFPREAEKVILVMKILKDYRAYYT